MDPIQRRIVGRLAKWCNGGITPEHKTLQSDYPVFWLKFGPNTPRIQVYVFAARAAQSVRTPAVIPSLRQHSVYLHRLHRPG
jgi:hypothetical protein